MIEKLHVAHPKTPAQVAADLCEAAARMTERGFAKFNRHADEDTVERGYAEHLGAVCLIGAFEPYRDMWAELRCPQALNALATFLHDTLFSYKEKTLHRIVIWNNAPERTKEDAIQALLTTAEKVEAGILSVL